MTAQLRPYGHQTRVRGGRDYLTGSKTCELAAFEIIVDCLLSVLCRTKDDGAEMELCRESRTTSSSSRVHELASLIRQQQNLHFKQRESKLAQAREKSLQ